MTRPASSRDRTGRAAIIVVSLIGHGLALVFLGLSAPVLREVRRIDPKAVELELWQPSRDVLTARPGPAVVTRPSPVAARRPALLTAPATMAPLPVSPSVARPSLMAGVEGSPPPLPASAAEGLRQALRGSTVGCANRDVVGLSRREREACDEVLGRPRNEASIVDPPMDPAKRAAWDAVAARKALVRKRKEGAVPPGLTANSNAGGTRTNGLGILDD